MVEQIVGTLIGRWYVTVFGVVFVVLAVRHLGAMRTAIYAPIALVVGATAENTSVLVGFPYTSYSFNPALRGHELWIVDVPLMVPMCYAFMAYFAFAAARLVVSGPYATGGRQPVLEYVLAVVLSTWAIWILDPVMRLGRYHAIGELFSYAGPGFWFGLPLGSQVGFFCTAGILIG
ncbi:MAG: carotenoid biosynthesis protein, partial [Mycobacterium sp.]